MLSVPECKIVLSQNVFFHLEQRWLLHRNGKRVNSRFDRVSAELEFTIGRSIRVSERMMKPAHTQDAVGAKPARHREQAGGNHRRNTQAFDFFAERSTATRACPSSRRHDDAVNSLLLEGICDLAANASHNTDIADATAGDE